MTVWRRCKLIAVSALIAAGIILSTPTATPALPFLDLIFRGIQVIQLSNMSDRQEVELGGQINRQLLSSEMTLYRDADITRYVDQIGQRLVPRSVRPNIPYTFQVVRDDSINAFATMGGYVYVTTGLIRAADNEAQLASVVAHEIAHIADKDALTQMREAAIAQGLMTAAGVDQNALANIGVELALRRPNSRSDEREADMMGLANLKAAGYAPSAMPAFMSKLVNRSSPPAFLSTHPSAGSRVQDLNAAIDPATANIGDGLDEAAYRSRIRNVPS
ncbi:MAG: M48 family metallopeptidase [Cyanobacteria bacterium P01_A01_bin.135]